MSGKLIYAGNLHTTVDANEITLVNYAAILSARMQGKRWWSGVGNQLKTTGIKW